MELVLLCAGLVITVYILSKFSAPKSTGSPQELSLSLVFKIATASIHGNLQHVLQSYQEARKRYGNIVAFPLFRFFLRPCMLILDHKLVNEALKSSACFGRPYHGFSKYYFDEVRGLGFHNDENNWREIRNFTFKKLKEHGTGKNAFDTISADEASHLVKNISENHLNKPVVTDDLVCIPMMNVLWRVISGKRFDFRDTEARAVYHIISNYFSVGDIKTVIVAGLIPILGNISNKFLWWIRFLKPLQTIRNFFIQYTKSSKNNFKEGETHTFTDSFLQKIHETSNPNSMFFGRTGEENLAATVGELLAVGAKSSSVTLQWILLYLAAHPEKQEILQKEIHTVLGGKFPTFDDKKLMPYTTAVMQESSRVNTLFPAGVPRLVSQDFQVGGFKISKGTIIASLSIFIHNDPEIWGDPEVFRPERFLSTDGLTNVSYENFLPFGVGKRSCPGKYLAQHNLFIFVATIFQQFSVSLEPKNTKCINLWPKHVAPTLIPSPHKLIFSHRSNNSC